MLVRRPVSRLDAVTVPWDIRMEVSRHERGHGTTDAPNMSQADERDTVRRFRWG
jgi:hypothetical protein